MSKIDNVMCKIISNEKEGFQAFNIAIYDLIETRKWNKDLFPRFNTDTIIGEMATRIIFNMKSSIFIPHYKYPRISILCEDILYNWILLWNTYFYAISNDPNMCKCLDIKYWNKIADNVYQFIDINPYIKRCFDLDLNGRIITTLIKCMLKNYPIDMSCSIYHGSYTLIMHANISKPIGNYKAFTDTSDT